MHVKFKFFLTRRVENKRIDFPTTLRGHRLTAANSRTINFAIAKLTVVTWLEFIYWRRLKRITPAGAEVRYKTSRWRIFY